MGKSGGNSSSSWLSAVKKAFRSPTKDNSDKRSCRSEDLEQQEQEKRRGKRRWIFGKPINCNKEQNYTANMTNIASHEATAPAGRTNFKAEAGEDEKRHAIEVAIATAAAAEAAVATAQAAVEFIRMTRPRILVRECQAATIIQKAFRGYLARRALRALKGLVKLQALIRGHTVRKRTTSTLKRMQALIRVQARVCDQRRRLSVSREGSLNSSSYTDKNSMFKDGDWQENESVEKEIDSCFMPRMNKEFAMKCERDLAHAFSDKIWGSHMEEYSGSEERLAKPEWTDRCRESYQWERPGRYSCDQMVPIKIVQVDNANHRNPYQHIKFSSSTYSQLHNGQRVSSFQSPLKSYQPELKDLQVRSASPRCLREDEQFYTKAQTPSLGCLQRRPSYMAETESAKARIRSHSVPRQQRPSTPERESTGIAKRRLLFGTPEDVASPSRRNI